MVAVPACALELLEEVLPLLLSGLLNCCSGLDCLCPCLCCDYTALLSFHMAVLLSCWLALGHASLNRLHVTTPVHCCCGPQVQARAVSSPAARGAQQQLAAQPGALRRLSELQLEQRLLERRVGRAPPISFSWVHGRDVPL